MVSELLSQPIVKSHNTVVLMPRTEICMTWNRVTVVIWTRLPERLFNMHHAVGASEKPGNPHYKPMTSDCIPVNTARL